VSVFVWLLADGSEHIAPIYGVPPNRGSRALLAWP